MLAVGEHGTILRRLEQRVNFSIASFLKAPHLIIRTRLCKLRSITTAGRSAYRTSGLTSGRDGCLAPLIGCRRPAGREAPPLHPPPVSQTRPCPPRRGVAQPWWGRVGCGKRREDLLTRSAFSLHVCIASPPGHGTAHGVPESAPDASPSQREVVLSEHCLQ